MFEFEEGGYLFGEVTRVGPSEEIESDFGSGTYRRLEIEVQPTDGAAPRGIWLPLAKGWPNSAHKRSVLMLWLHQADQVSELSSKFRAAGTIEEAFKSLEGRFLEFQEKTIEIGTPEGVKEKEYLIPVRCFPSRVACSTAASSRFTDTGAATPEPSPELSPEPEPAKEVEVSATDRETWSALDSIADPEQRIVAFASLLGESEDRARELAEVLKQ